MLMRLSVQLRQKVTKLIHWIVPLPLLTPWLTTISYRSHSMASSTMDNQTIIYYNLQGLNQGSSLLSDLCTSKNASLIFVQEHWMNPCIMSQIIYFSSNYTCFGISAMEEILSHGV